MHSTVTVCMTDATYSVVWNPFLSPDPVWWSRNISAENFHEGRALSLGLKSVPSNTIPYRLNKEKTVWLLCTLLRLKLMAIIGSFNFVMDAIMYMSVVTFLIIERSTPFKASVAAWPALIRRQGERWRWIDVICVLMNLQSSVGPTSTCSPSLIVPL